MTRHSNFIYPSLFIKHVSPYVFISLFMVQNEHYISNRHNKHTMVYLNNPKEPASTLFFSERTRIYIILTKMYKAHINYIRRQLNIT